MGRLLGQNKTSLIFQI